MAGCITRSLQGLKHFILQSSYVAAAGQIMTHAAFHNCALQQHVSRRAVATKNLRGAAPLDLQAYTTSQAMLRSQIIYAHASML